MATSKQTPNATPRGRGRKPLQEGVDTVPMMIRLTRPQREKVERLGGAAWVRKKIDMAKEPKE
jgi:CxxC motif-containing protein (DUF1111 family)